MMMGKIRSRPGRDPISNTNKNGVGVGDPKLPTMLHGAILQPPLEFYSLFNTQSAVNWPANTILGGAGKLQQMASQIHCQAVTKQDFVQTTPQRVHVNGFS